MEFNEKLQELRKKKGITQEEAAKALFVSRTAISKWESGRGYPGIDSLKAIATFYGVSVDQLLNSEELLTLAEDDKREKERSLRDLVYGLLDFSVIALLFLPFFCQKKDGGVLATSLLSLETLSPYLKGTFLFLTVGIFLWGILTLALQKYNGKFWIKNAYKLSFFWSVTAVLLFTLCQQVYSAVYLFITLIIKTFLIIKKK